MYVILNSRSRLKIENDIIFLALDFDTRVCVNKVIKNTCMVRTPTKYADNYENSCREHVQKYPTSQYRIIILAKSNTPDKIYGTL